MTLTWLGSMKRTQTIWNGVHPEQDTTSKRGQENTGGCQSRGSIVGLRRMFGIKSHSTTAANCFRNGARPKPVPRDLSESLHKTQGHCATGGVQIELRTPTPEIHCWTRQGFRGRRPDAPIVASVMSPKLVCKQGFSIFLSGDTGSDAPLDGAGVLVVLPREPVDASHLIGRDGEAAPLDGLLTAPPGPVLDLIQSERVGSGYIHVNASANCLPRANRPSHLLRYWVRLK